MNPAAHATLAIGRQKGPDAHGLQRRYWVAEFITGDGVEPLTFPQSGARSQWGYPVQQALQLLDALAAEGWRLMHVSEDHGLYNGADAPSEAYLARVRYLLMR